MVLHEIADKTNYYLQKLIVKFILLLITIIIIGLLNHLLCHKTPIVN